MKDAQVVGASVCVLLAGVAFGCGDDQPPETPDTLFACTSNAQCSSATPVCDVDGTRMCVQCTTEDETACANATPVCGDDHTCRTCQAHSECDSNVCLDDGTCADESSVAYVAADGTDNATCTLATPCNAVADALATNRPYVKVTGTIDEAITLGGGRVVTFLGAPGAKLTRENNGPLLTIEDSANVSIYDLEISGALGTNVGISIPVATSVTLQLTRATVSNNAGGGISASSGTLSVSQSTFENNTGGGISASSGTLSVSQSTFENNTGSGISASSGTLSVSQSTFENNTGGGISVLNGSFEIVGNVFFANGSGTGSVGGVSISASQDASNRLDFNSFNKNQTQDGLGSAIQCTAGTFTARNNIMSGNGTLSNTEQVGGTCSHTYSLVQPGALPPGIGNTSVDPLFVNTTTGDLHIQPGSPARGAADPTSDLDGVAARDIDGDMRTAPSDIGADEIP